MTGASLNRRIEEFKLLRVRGLSVSDAVDMAGLLWSEYEQAVAEGVLTEDEAR